VERFEEGERIAARIRGGAPAAPRRNEECSSHGTPTRATSAIPWRLAELSLEWIALAGDADGPARFCASLRIRS